MPNMQLPLDPMLAKAMLLKRLSETKRKGDQTQYTCEAEIRRQVMTNVNAKADALKREPQGGQQMIENWIRFVCEKAEVEGRLLSNRQYQDWVMGRKLARGDRARFIGPDREETSQDGGVSVRPTGQIGVIVDMEKVGDANVATFFPAEPVLVMMPSGHVEKKLVNFQAREGTAEWRQLERC